MSRDRFTEKDDNGKWAVRLSEDCQMTIECSEKVNNDGSKTCTPVLVYAPFVDRLAEFEESGFHTEELQKIRKEILYSQAFGITMSRERFDEICEAERTERLKVIPCKVGDTVWVVEDRFVNGRKLLRCRINEFTISDKEGTIYAVLDGAEEFCFMRRFKAVPAESFGRTVFLNKAEAETALKLQKMEKKNEIEERERNEKT